MFLYSVWAELVRDGGGRGGQFFFLGGGVGGGQAYQGKPQGQEWTPAGVSQFSVLLLVGGSELARAGEGWARIWGGAKLTRVSRRSCKGRNGLLLISVAHLQVRSQQGLRPPSGYRQTAHLPPVPKDAPAFSGIKMFRA